MAQVPQPLLSAMDSALPIEPEDYTDWELDDETDARIGDYERNDVNSDEDWELFTEETWEDSD